MCFCFFSSSRRHTRCALVTGVQTCALPISYFVWLNRGKESVAVDLKQADDLALVQRMLAKADVFIQNLAPGAAGRLGLGHAGLRDEHPRLITCDIRSEEHTSELQSLMRISYAVFCLKKKNNHSKIAITHTKQVKN